LRTSIEKRIEGIEKQVIGKEKTIIRFVEKVNGVLIIGQSTNKKEIGKKIEDVPPDKKKKSKYDFSRMKTDEIKEFITFFDEEIKNDKFNKKKN